MADMKRYLDLAGLKIYDGKIKGIITAGDQAAKDYADSLATNYDAAGTAQTKADAALESAKEYTDALANGQVNTNKEAIAGIVADYLKAADKTELEGKIDAVEDKADANAEAIAAINDENDGILVTAKAYADSKDAAIAEAKKAGDDAQADVDALEAKVGTVPEGSTVMGIITNIQENAYDDTEIRGLISGLDSNKADKTQVATDIADAVKAETDARVEAVKGVQDAVDALSGTHATDKKALEDAIALKASKEELKAVSDVADAAVKQADYDVKVKALEDEDARIADLVAAEVERATGVEESLQNQINTIMNNPETENVIDSINEFTEYIATHGAIANGFRIDIDKNTGDIAAEVKRAGEAESALSGRIDDHVALDHDFASADATLKSELEGKINGKVAQGDFDAVEGRVDTLESEMDEVQGAVATKAEAQDLADAVSALEGADSALSGRLDAVETMLGDGDGSVADQIEDAKEAAIEAAAEDAANKDVVVLSEAQGYTDAEVAKDRARIDALEAVDHEHANKALLDTYTQTEANLADAVAKKHEHANAAELNKIADGDVAKWNAAEQNAKDYADGLNSTMTNKVDGIDGRLQAAEAAVATKAEAEDLAELASTHATDKEALEAKDAELAAAISKFTAITEDEIKEIFGEI